MEAYELVEKFQKLWRKVAKNIPLEAGWHGKHRLIAMFLVSGPLQVYLALIVGPQGGVKETVIVIDPRQRITTDRLVIYSTDGGDVGRGALLKLDNLRHQVLQKPRPQRRDTAILLCRAAMWDYSQQWGDAPVPPDLLCSMPSTSQSLQDVLVAGAPSLGRGGGGVSGKN